MKVASNFLCLAATAAALLLAGCPQTPTRPNPSETVMGPNPSGTRSPGGEFLNTTPINVNPDVPGLQVRDEGFDLNNQNRTLLGEKTVYFDFDRSDIKQS